MILSEFESKELLRSYGISTVDERLARNPDEAVRRANELGYPVAVKLCARGLAHKSERNLVRLGLARDDEVRAASADVLSRRQADESEAQLLVQRMVGGRRELILGLTRDRQFGPCVMLGLGGVLAEAIRDVAFRVAPLTSIDATEMMEDLKAAPLLGAFRGEPEIDREALALALVAIGAIGLEHPEIASIDVNPMIVVGRRPVAVDAAIEQSSMP